MSQVGELLADRYRLESQLGSGAMGVVWLATDERLQRRVAVKQLISQTALDPARSEQARERAMREGRIAGRLHHPNVVAVHDVIEHDDLPVLVMEYLPSRSFADVLVEEGEQPVERVAEIGAQAAGALAAAHEAGIVHRDVKPANVLLGQDGSVKITDFGISLAAGDVSVTQTGLLNGTPAYLAPEIARGDPPAAASDVFSLGATLYAALEGRAPFGVDAENSLAVLHEVARGEVDPPQRAGALEPVLAQMMRVAVEARPTAERTAEMLRTVAAGRPVAPAAGFPDDDRTRPIAAVTESAPVGATPAGTGTAAVGTAAGATAVGASAPGNGTRVDAEPAQRAEPGPGRRRYRTPLALLGAVVAAAVVLAVLLVPQRDSAAPPAPVAAPADLERAVADYYGLLPQHPDTAWTKLGPGMRSQGRSGYDGYWSSVRSVAVVDPPRATGNTVHVGVELRKKDGSTARESHDLRMIERRGAPLINSDALVRSETTAAPPPPVVIHRPAPDQHKGNGNKGNGNKGNDKGDKGDKGKGGDKGGKDKKNDD